MKRPAPNVPFKIFMKPFLKWAGNKYSIITRIQALLPHGARLIEPFTGSAAVFLNTDYPAYMLADANADLIAVYHCLQTDGPLFISDCQAYFTPKSNTPEAYYAYRAQFNVSSDARLRACLFVYLNRHGYNGLCRYNASGGFNVPFGRYQAPYFPQIEMQAFAKKAQQATFVHQDFTTTLHDAQPGDIVYCDPPYVPLSTTASFTSYAQSPFGLAQQQQLASLAQQLAQNGIPVLISNHNTPFVQHAYATAQILPFAVQRNISCNGAKRGKADEVLALFSS